MLHSEIASRWSIRTISDLRTLLILEVEDAGIGIAEEVARIFDVFVQTGAQLPRKGTDCSCALRSGSCRFMGGTMSVHSAPGQGSLGRCPWSEFRLPM